MFAVPGWAVSANSLKVETSKPSGPPAAAAAATAAAPRQDEPGSDNHSNKSKKRKRPNALPSNVTAANVADLWERVIEGKSAKKPKMAKDPKKQQQQQNGDHVKKQSAAGQENDGDAQQSGKKAAKKEKKGRSNGGKQDENVQGKEEDANADADADGDADGAQPEASAKKSRKDKKKNKKNKQTAENQEGDPDTQQQQGKASTAATTITTTTTAPTPPAPKLTPMQAAMREKLISARFRHLNETLYTRPSAEAFRLFQESPEMFREYHEGFRRQVDVWPENPVDGYIAEIQQRGRVKTPAAAPPPHRGHGRDSQRQQQQQPPTSKTDGDAAAAAAAAGGVLPLPRNAKGTCTIADLGCGDAKLAAALDAEPSSRKKQLRVQVLSYDLHGDDDDDHPDGGEGGRNPPRVTRADIANLPLADGSVEVAVFCLALMGTNWLDFVEEAYRVLRWKGELWVAEIKSRFAGAGAAAKSASKKSPGGSNGNGVVSHSVGNRRKPGAAGGAGGKKGGGGKKNGGDEEGDDGDHEAELAIEVDGAEDRRGETDVSGFVEALRRRGFVLQGEPDLRNRMFVRMRFVKAAPATVGKCAAPESAAAAAVPQDRHQHHHHGRGGRPSLTQKRDALKKFLETDGPAGAEGDRARAVAEERAILKPCVYKIR